MKRKMTQIALSLLSGVGTVLAVLLLLGGISIPVWADSGVLYVAPGGNCGGVSPCYVTIQTAVDAAANDDIVKVAQGTYTGSGFQVVYINKPITLTGGYAITDWDHFYPITQPTVIDAENVARRRGVYVDGIGVATITLKGLTIQRGNAQNANGGGIYVIDGSTVILQDSQVLSNTASSYSGGGFYASGARVWIETSRFQGNNAYMGGGLCMDNYSTGFVTDNVFQGNHADVEGGGIRSLYSIITANNNAFLGNNSGMFGGAVSGYVGETTLDNNLFQDNTTREGGGLYIMGGGGFINTTVSNNLFQSNVAVRGGGIDLNTGHGDRVTINANTFLSNVVDWNGGGLFVLDGSVTLNENFFQNNSADIGGGMFVGNGVITMTSNTFYSNTATTSGGGIASGSGIIDAQNDIIAENVSPWEGVYLSGGTLTARHWTLAENGNYALTTNGGGTVVLTNTIVASHTVAGLWGGDITGDHILFFNSGISCGGGAVCTNKFTGDPRFVNPAIQDYHLSSGSPASDKGIEIGVTDDIDGDPRPMGSAPDLGADEWPGPQISIVKSGPSTAVAGHPITYTLTITNSGLTTAANLLITDTIPAGATYLDGGTHTGDEVNWTVSSLAAGNSTRVEFAVTAMQTVTNSDYLVSADGGVKAAGDVAVVTTITYEPVAADFSASPRTGVLPLIVNFTNLSIGTYDTCVWVFGDGGTSMACIAPTHTYTMAGVYTARLTITGLGGTDTETKVGYITTRVRIAGLSASNDSPTVLGQTTMLSATIVAGNDVAYAWSLGDGSTASGDIVSHIYSVASVYTAVVTATNSEGSMTATTRVTITNLAPVANAGVDQFVPVNTTVTLNGSDSYDPDGHTPLAYRWQQTGGLAVNLSNNSISQPTFTTPGASTVLTFTLTVTDAYGLVDPTPDEIIVTVRDTSISGMAASNSSPTTLGHATSLTATIAAGSNVAYAWAFGDGLMGSGAMVTHTYPTVGVYTAIVTASNSVTAVTATTTVTITSHPIPQEFFVYLPLVLR